MNSSKESKPKLAVIVSRFPYPLEKGDKLRAYYQIKELSNDFSITLIAISDIAIEDSSKEHLSQFCDKIVILRLKKLMILIQLIKCFFSDKPFQIGYFYDPFIKTKIKKVLDELQPDHIYCQLIRTTEYVKNYHSCYKTLDYMDTLSKGIERRIEKSPFIWKWLFRSEAGRLGRYEQKIFTYFENKTIISDQDRDLIQHPERKKIHVIPNGIDGKFFDYPITEKKYDLVFVGNLSYAPNVEAVQFISLIAKRKPELKILISGASPSNQVKKLIQQNSNMSLKGWVEDIRQSYAEGKIFIAPMMIGTGMQNKLLEAMALGVPCITSPLANNAIKGDDMKNIVVASDLDEFILKIDHLLQNSELRTEIGRSGCEFVKSQYTWQKTTKVLSSIIQQKS